MKRLLIIGGSGGLGKQISSWMTRFYIVTSLSSEDVDVTYTDNVEHVISKYEPDLILNLAAINIDGLIKTRFKQNDIQTQINVNALGASNVIGSACHYWSLTKPGKLVMMSSFLSSRPVKGAGIYSATKAFIDNLVKTSAIENAKYGITVNSIQAGFFDAGLTDKLPPKIKEALPSRIPVGRLGQIEELAHAIKFLFENDYVTGTNLVIDGGVGLV